MKATSAVFTTNRFPAEWGENPDVEGPPGRDFAHALLRHLHSDSSVLNGRESVGEWHWEHSSWHFWIKHGPKVYHVDLEASSKESPQQRWRISITRIQGLLRSLLSSRKSRFDVDDTFLARVEEALRHVAAVDRVDWLTEDQALQKFWAV